MRALMSSLLPAPSMIVVLSLSMMTFLARPRSFEREVFELDAEGFEDRLAAGEDGDVFQHGLAAVAVAGGLHRTALEGAAERVDDERGEGLAFDVFGHDEERLALLDDGFEDRHQVLDVRDLLLVDEDVGVFEHGRHRVGVGDEVGREVAAVELHAFDPFGLGLEALAFIDGDDAVLADLFHRVGEELADFAVVVGGDRGDVGHLALFLDLDRHLRELLD